MGQIHIINEQEQEGVESVPVLDSQKVESPEMNHTSQQQEVETVQVIDSSDQQRVRTVQMVDTSHGVEMVTDAELQNQNVLVYTTQDGSETVTFNLQQLAEAGIVHGAGQTIVMEAAIDEGDGGGMEEGGSLVGEEGVVTGEEGLETGEINMVNV